MGLAASQARLLTLTSRQHAIEYKAQKLEAEKLQLANDSDQVYNTYLNALDATKVQYRVVNNDGTTAFSNATFADLKNAGFLFNVNGVVCNNLTDVKAALQSEYGITITAGDSYTMLTTLVQEGYVVIMERNQDASDYYNYNPGTGNVYYDDPLIGSEGTKEWDFTFSGGLKQKDNPTDYEHIKKLFNDVSVSTSTRLQEVTDEVGLKKAEAQYEADMNKINAKDTRYDTELSQLETERNAIKEEIEALKNVAKENVDRTFKIFS